MLLRLALLTTLLLPATAVTRTAAAQDARPAQERLLTLLPGMVDATSPQIARAVRAYRGGDFATTALLLDDVIQQQPGRAELHQLLASALLRDGRGARALLVAEAAAERFPDHAGLALLHGEALTRQERFSDALAVLAPLRDAFESGTTPPPPSLDREALDVRLGQLYQLAGAADVQNGAFGAALERFEAARQLLPDDPAPHQNVAYALAKLGRWDAARQAAEAGLRRFPGTEGLLRIKVQALAETDATGDDLLPTLRSLYRQRPDDLDIGITYGRALLSVRDAETHSQAQTVFDDLLERFPRERRLYDMLAEINHNGFNTPGAIAVRRREQRQFPDDRGVPRQIARLYERTGDFDRARALYDSLRVLGGPGMLGDARAAARTYVEQERLAEADSAYRAVLAEAPGAAATLRPLADLLERRAAWLDAEAMYARLEAAATDDAERAYALTHRGRAIERQDRPAEALDVYDQATALSPTDPLPYYRRAVLLRRRDGAEAAYPPAREALRKGLLAVEDLQRQVTEQMGRQGELQDADAPRRSEALNDLVTDIFEFFGDDFPRRRTEPVVRDLLARYPGSGRFSYLAGQYFATHDDTQEALRLYTQAVREAPTLRAAHLALGALQEQGGKLRQATLSYERARSLDERQPDAYRALLRLYRRQGRLDVLIQRWQARLRGAPSNDTLREHLIEALHKTDRYDEARQLVGERSPDRAEGNL